MRLPRAGAWGGDVAPTTTAQYPRSELRPGPSTGEWGHSAGAAWFQALSAEGIAGLLQTRQRKPDRSLTAGALTPLAGGSYNFCTLSAVGRFRPSLGKPRVLWQFASHFPSCRSHVWSRESPR